MENPVRCGLCRAILDASALAASVRDEYGDEMCDRCEPVLAKVRTLFRGRGVVKALVPAPSAPR